ncbi:hypothetical protein MYX82_12540 [Acidobacteria bacterium AH-259-D05]|nr:hypothetical protein [Acidobacteria bacterium AH-259-D05]
MSDEKLIPLPSTELIKASEVPALLSKIRPAWQAKSLILRVRRLLDVDPGSACQRLLNAAIHDLREKIVIAGVDIAEEAAKQFKLPPVTTPEDVENYSTSKLIDLAFRIGLLSRPEWRRMCRCYEIRRDLEHEDDEYQASIEDCIYIFNTCINVVLAIDPVHLVKVKDVKDLVEQSAPAVPEPELITDFEHLPQLRQAEIGKFLMSIALDPAQADVVQENAYNFLVHLEPVIQSAVRLKLAEDMQRNLGREALDRRQVRVAVASGVFPYLRNTQRLGFFERVYAQMEKVGAHWTSYDEHGELLRSFQEIGGLTFCPDSVRRKILKWLVVAYIGVPGGRTIYGNVRHVFNSNTAAPLVRDILSTSRDLITDELSKLRDDRDIERSCSNTHIARRFEELLDLVETNTEAP